MTLRQAKIGMNESRKLAATNKITTPFSVLLLFCGSSAYLSPDEICFICRPGKMATSRGDDL